jgi:hypothetical protein
VCVRERDKGRERDSWGDDEKKKGGERMRKWMDKEGGRTHRSAYISIRQHTSAYVSIRQHTSAHRDCYKEDD